MPCLTYRALLTYLAPDITSYNVVSSDISIALWLLTVSINIVIILTYLAPDITLYNMVSSDISIALWLLMVSIDIVIILTYLAPDITSYNMVSSDISMVSSDISTALWLLTVSINIVIIIIILNACQIPEVFQRLVRGIQNVMTISWPNIHEYLKKIVLLNTNRT